MNQDLRAAVPLPAGVRARIAGWKQHAELRHYVVYAAAVLVFLLFAVILHDDGFLSSSNLINIGRQSAPIAVMAVGMSFALASSEIDLSVGSVAALSSLVAAEVVGNHGFVVGTSAAVAVGAGIGLVNGFITVKVRIPSFLVTLGMLGIVSGIARNMNNLAVVADTQRHLPGGLWIGLCRPGLLAARLDCSGRASGAYRSASVAVGSPCTVGGF